MLLSVNGDPELFLPSTLSFWTAYPLCTAQDHLTSGICLPPAVEQETSVTLGSARCQHQRVLVFVTTPGIS